MTKRQTEDVCPHTHHLCSSYFISSPQGADIFFTHWGFQRLSRTLLGRRNTPWTGLQPVAGPVGLERSCWLRPGGPWVVGWKAESGGKPARTASQSANGIAEAITITAVDPGIADRCVGRWQASLFALLAPVLLAIRPTESHCGTERQPAQVS